MDITNKYFSVLIARLEGLGWKEMCPERHYWEFRKNKWICRIYHNPHFSVMPVKFYRIGG